MNESLARKVKALAGVVEDWLGARKTSLKSTNLEDACRYALGSGGKRIRPVLALMVGEMLEVRLESLKTVALAVELVHTSSLIHDDLPALDNDTLRRGKPTCHVVHGEGTAIIAGDILIAQAFRALTAGEVDAAVKVAWTKGLADATEALCDGQALDLDYTADDLEHADEEEAEKLLQDCHRRKTGALIAFAASAPVELFESGDKVEAKRRLARFGIELGLLFQMTDDVLDAASGLDEGDGMSLVGLYGVPRTLELIKEKQRVIASVLEPFGERASFLLDFANALAERTQ